MKLVVLVLGLILITAVGLCGCGGSREYVKMTAENTESATFIPLKEADPELTSTEGTDLEPVPTAETESPQLTALADSLEEAQEIANLYGIELDSYSYGVAAYSTDKDIAELLLFGEEHDYPTLAPNQSQEIHTDTEQ